jgi:tetratricopeptide (TPR) repeat protein
MEQETLSFWADIGKYEETLAKDPNSFCFAPLADLYRKLGLLDEAIAVAKKGCETHSGYVGGFLALGRACFEKGMKEESRAALEKVAAATPENHLAQKLLSQLYCEAGDTPSAIKALQMVLSVNPEDQESHDLLNTLQRGTSSVDENSGGPITGNPLQVEAVVEGTALDFELSLDDAEVIEDLTEEIVDLHEEDPLTEAGPSSGPEADTDRKDPLKTATLAELYVSQGFLSSAVTIYQELLKAEPGNVDYEKRLLQIEQALAAQGKEEGLTADQQSSKPEELSVASVHPQHADEVSGGSDPVVILEKWLENIQRRR